jgi:hypothetical protein
MAVSQIDGGRQIKSATITDTQIASGAAIALTKLSEAVLQADGGQALTGDLPAGGFKVTGLGTPTASGDAATKSYVDTIKSGFSWKDPVRVATTTNAALTTAYENGDSVDGVTLVTGDRIALMGQTTGSENGIYTVNASGAPTRATDADSASELKAATFQVLEGTANGDKVYMQTVDTITVGTTALVFTQVGATGTSITAGNGLVQNSNAFDVVSGNTGIVANANDITLTLATNSLLDITSGLRLARGTTGQIIVVNGSGDPVMATMSGDATIVAGGAVTVASTIQRTAGFVDRETPSGSVNGSNTSYTLANTPVSGSEHVYLNGLLQEPGAGNDYTISGGTITYLTAPLTGDKIRVSYRK